VQNDPPHAASILWLRGEAHGRLERHLRYLDSTYVS